MPGLPAALWLLGLFAAAPALRTSARYDFPDRLRDALILGISIPFALGLVHALYAVACWCVLAICIAVAYARGLAKPARAPNAAAPIPYLLIGALLAVGWPQLMRPLLEGDSLSYHLPNAASWIQAHSIWTTATRYWWYPPASELFAAGLYVTGGPFALPWCGFVALALLGFRIAAWARTAFAAPAAARRSARGRDRNRVPARDSGRNAAERRLAGCLLARELVGAADLAERDGSARACRHGADQTAGLVVRRNCIDCDQSQAWTLDNDAGSLRALARARRNFMETRDRGAGEHGVRQSFWIDDSRARMGGARSPCARHALPHRRLRRSRCSRHSPDPFSAGASAGWAGRPARPRCSSFCCPLAMRVRSRSSQPVRRYGSLRRPWQRER